jgi:hypothetical protein
MLLEVRENIKDVLGLLMVLLLTILILILAG